MRPPGSPPDDGRRPSTGPSPPSSGAGRKSFKSKLREAIQQAEVAEAQALHNQHRQDKRSLAIATLIEGFPQAFIDFFELTHPPPSAVVPDDEEKSTSQQTDEMTPDAMMLLKSQLATADAASRANDSYAVYDAFHHLANFFEQRDDYKKTVFFLEKCLTVAEDIGWVEGRMAANLALGMVFERMGQDDAAVMCHEQYLAFAEENDRQDDVRAAHSNLIQVYTKRALAHSAAGDADAAMSMHHRALSAAEQCNDVASIGLACQALGRLHSSAGEPATAQTFQSRALEAAQASEDKRQEAIACFALAESYQCLGQDEEAIDKLEQYLELTRVIDPEGQAQACCHLGIIYLRQGLHSQAIMYLERFFETARSMNDRRLLDIARFNLGVARGSARTPALLNLLTTDTKTLLNWKNVRLPFTP